MDVSITGPQTSRPILGAAVGLAGVVVLNACFIAIDPQITRAVPLLLLLVPVMVASLIGGWKASVPLAVLTAGVYSFHFVAPIGAIRLGFTEDTLTMITFVCVAVFLSELGNRRDARRNALEARGLKVIVAGTGLDALRHLSVQEPQLIMLDLGLPDFDGVELCRRMRQTQRCPIIVVTADGDEGRMVAALDIGADDYITKPYGPELLMARVRVAMRHANALAGLVEETTFQLGDLFLDVEAHLVLVDGVRSNCRLASSACSLRCSATPAGC